jgi:hypothetical protein
VTSPAGVGGHQQVLGKPWQPLLQGLASDRVDQVVAGDVDGVTGTKRQRQQVMWRQAGLDPPGSC